MTKKLSLKQLEKKRAAIQAKIWDIQAEISQQENRKLIGKCFKYRNCYSCPNDESDYWWVYFKVTHLAGDNICGLQFQTDKHGEITIKAAAIKFGKLGAGWNDMRLNEFCLEWEKVKVSIEKIKVYE